MRVISAVPADRNGSNLIHSALERKIQVELDVEAGV